MTHIPVTYLSNAFSWNMLASFPMSVNASEITEASAAQYMRMGAVSAVGHQSTADVFSSELGVPVPMQRTTVSLKGGDRLIVGQYRGPRLEEGVTSLPEGATIQWLLVLIG